MENYYKETSRVGEFLLKTGKGDQIVWVGDEEYDQIARVKAFLLK